MSLHAVAFLVAGALAAQPAVVASATPSPSPSPASEPAPAASPTATGALATAVPTATPAPTATPSQLCGTATVTPLEIVDSKTAQPGQVFKFTVKSIDDKERAFASLAAGQTGYATIAVVRHARAGGEPGLLVLETRYILASDGTHVPVGLIRSVNGLVMGRTRNSPGLLGLIPYVGYVTGTYDALHKGTDVAIGPGDTLIVTLGDGSMSGTCSIPTILAPPLK